MVITAPTAVVATASSSNVSCAGGTDGTATAVGSGGSGSYSYLWSDGQATATAVGLSASSYTVTVTDASGCTATASVVVTAPAAIIISLSSNDVSCAGNDGTAQASVTGGTGAYTYAWSSGQTSSTIVGLAVNSYTLTVTDANGCTATGTTSVADGCVCSMVAAATVDNQVSCNGGNDGQATAAQTQGTAPISYSWSDGQTTATAVGLVAASYTVTLTDVNGCTATATANITEPSILVATATSTSESCAGNDGTVTAVATGGTGVYTFSWSTGQTASFVNGLNAANYTVTVTDVNGCTATTVVAVSDGCACPIVAAATVNNQVSCNGGNDGQITATQTQGVAPISYLWTGGQTTATATGLTAGIYVVTVVDNNGCAANASVTLTAPSAIIISASSNAVSCAGNDGTAQATVTGGTGAYTYAWSNGQTSSTIAGLAINSYGVTVTDANGCTATATTSVADGCVCSMVAAATVNNQVSCNGGNDGQATATQTQGTAPISYSWSDGQTTATAVGLSASSYTVTVTDVNGCTATSTVVLTAPSAIIISASSNAVSCAGNDGTAQATVTGGTGAYTYAWSNGQTSSTIAGLAINSYGVTVTDANGCTATATTSVADGCVCSMVAAATVNNQVSCNGGNDGQATATQTQGTAPISYSWSDGQTTATAVGLSASSYTVTVTDVNGCTATASTVVTEPISALSGLVTAVSNPLCNNDANGSITVNAFGGTANYTFDLGNGAQSNGTFVGLAAGTYTITVTDANGCIVTVSSGLSNPAAVSVNTSVSNTIACNGGSDGVAIATAFGGAGSYNFVWSNGQALSTATGLSATVYTVTATDANGCTSSTSITLSEPTALNVSATQTTAVSCSGALDGVAGANASGGVGAYTFNWSNGQASASATGLSAGTYTVTATDQNACIAIDSVQLTAPATIALSSSISSNYNGAAISCNGAADGAAAVVATGGSGTYTYQWLPSGQTNATASGLPANVYTVQVTDANNCNAFSTITITEPSLVVVSATLNSTLLCFGDADASATATGIGGTGALNYLWSNGQGTPTSTGLSAQLYTVSVTDQNGCFDQVVISVTEPTAVTASAIDNGDGTATVTTTGGNSPYSYQWDATAGNQTTATATGLVHNSTYTITITDQNGCVTTTTVTVNITGLDNVPDLSKFDVQPNPNDGSFVVQISFTKAQKSTVRLTNVLGQSLAEYNFEDANFTVPIDIAEQASGVYFVVLNCSNKSVTRKVVVTK